MTKEIFIDTLRRALYGKLDDRTLTDHIRYYENYILQEMSSGKSEQEVLNELGDPRLIARTILDTSNAHSSYGEYTVSDEADEGEENSVKVQKFEGWKATLLMAAIVLFVLLVLIFVFKIVIALLPMLIVIAVIVWIAKRIWN
uniref:DUF1700 domain-containing protein n=1 Tax=Agathobacter sp. TaxID=2021311 RepID=UPI004055C3CB